MKKVHQVLIVLGVLLLGCSKEQYNKTPASSIEIRIDHSVDGQELTMDKIMYSHPGGYAYSVTKLKYYLSDIKLIKSGGSVSVSKFIYIDALNPETYLFHLPENSSFNAIEFTFGLYEQINHHDSLPLTNENLKMIWPDEMGGGYHFMKLEGHYAPGNDAEKGYTMHLGANNFQFKVRLNTAFTLNNSRKQLVLNMNINEWFKNPVLYDFEKDGNYSMGIPENMKLLQNNGQTVFSIKSN
ncbi:MAG: hypothetical protein CL840_21065 [Crocinitomicaceae bacterium]|nr:hypothetical protein [Crocinitomicaceae bacterium]|tara:strand:- start:9707 stop:10426 length:720 start_codon:yes stop_codon:yes gene_type:complete